MLLGIFDEGGRGGRGFANLARGGAGFFDC